MNTIKKIFLIDDDKDDCSFFSEILSEIYNDYKPLLVIANDGIELFIVLEVYVPPPPEVIFLDINMPGKDGITCLKEIRASPKFAKIPVVMLTTTADDKTINKTFEIGANYYLTKPSSYSKLKHCLTHVLSFGAQKLLDHPLKQNYVIRC